ncbi:MAG: ATP-dependent RNA helicase HrpA, partial [Pseudomonadota bacterium]
MQTAKLLQNIEHSLDSCMLADRWKLRSELRQLQRTLRDKDVDEHNQQRLATLSERVAASIARREQRQQRVPSVINYPPSLPVVVRLDDLKSAIAANQVVIIAGETGSGKTTQLPKICLELGRGVSGMIGHTQPRRLAARTVAMRIADELGVQEGREVAHQVRFTDTSTELTLIKLMTDGILLAETQNDPWLNRYDMLIIDEAHERSLNIDFLLGYLKTLLPKRPDLKVVITSATIEVEKFSAHFGNAPVIEVSGRTYPVTMLYRPATEQEEDQELPEQVVAAYEEILRLERQQKQSYRDVLVFLSGEKEIRECADSLRKQKYPGLDILPLYARLSNKEQQRVFESHAGRRIVLTTNVAETSLTVPGIGYVIDSGLARISRYSVRSKIQRLPIEPVSQASANQRAGRCGRLGPGTCIRLYAETDFKSRPEFTEPEILRTNLASVILQMLALKLGDIEQFPFLEPPDSRAIRDGFRLLEELQAVTTAGALIQRGRDMARFPLDPRLARVLLEAAHRHCLHELLIVVSALSIQDPRERPMDRQQAADEAHRRFWHPD